MGLEKWIKGAIIILSIYSFFSFFKSDKTLFLISIVGVVCLILWRAECILKIETEREQEEKSRLESKKEEISKKELEREVQIKNRDAAIRENTIKRQEAEMIGYRNLTQEDKENLIEKFADDDYYTEYKADRQNFDKYFIDAAKLIVKEQICSFTIIQKSLRLGIVRTGKIIDQLEACGIIGINEENIDRIVIIKSIEELELLSIIISKGEVEYSTTFQTTEEIFYENNKTEIERKRIELKEIEKIEMERRKRLQKELDEAEAKKMGVSYEAFMFKKENEQKEKDWLEEQRIKENEILEQIREKETIEKRESDEEHRLEMQEMMEKIEQQKKELLQERRITSQKVAKEKEKNSASRTALLLTGRCPKCLKPISKWSSRCPYCTSEIG